MENFCPKCGTEITADYIYCPECGAKVEKLKNEKSFFSPFFRLSKKNSSNENPPSSVTSVSKVEKVSAGVDNTIISEITGKEDEPFFMPIKKIISVEGRGTVAIGRIKAGMINLGDEVEIVGIRPTQKTSVTCIEKNKERLTQAKVGDDVGILLRGVERRDVLRGQVLAKPETIAPHTKLLIRAYVLNASEGGRHTPFFTGYRPQICFDLKSKDMFYLANLPDKCMTCTVELPDGVDMVKPGDSLDFIIDLLYPLAVKECSKFEMREAKKKIAFGMILKIIS